MTRRLLLPTATLEAALIATSLYFAFAIPAGPAIIRRSPPDTLAVAILVPVLFAPLAIGGVWLFRRLQSGYPRRAAGVAAITFVALAPLWLMIGFPLAQFPGGYSAMLLGRPFGLLGAFLGVALAVALPNSLLCAAAIWAANRWAANGGHPKR